MASSPSLVTALRSHRFALESPVIVGESEAISTVRERVVRVAAYECVSVFLIGEVGTGKDLVARALHDLTTPGSPFVKVDCATLDAALLEEEVSSAAYGGTVFLKRIEQASPPVRARLDRILETRTIRDCSGAPVPLSARIVTSASAEVGADIGLEPDLLQRVAEFTIELPPLRERRMDIIPLANAFLAAFGERHDTNKELSRQAANELTRFAWPGNVRQLRAVIEDAAIAVTGRRIEHGDLRRGIARTPRFVSARPELTPMASFAQPHCPPTFPTLRDMERQLIVSAWAEHESNLSRAAKHLGLPRSTLRDKLRKYGIL
jgi:DNA-binding NtrC family response regulator